MRFQVLVQAVICRVGEQKSIALSLKINNMFRRYLTPAPSG